MATGAAVGATVGALVAGTGVGAAAAEELAGGEVGTGVGGLGAAVGGTGVDVGGAAHEATTPAVTTADNRKNSRRVILRFIFFPPLEFLAIFS